MITAFKTLFTLAIPHDYYGGLSSDFEFIVPGATQQTARNLKLLAKPLQNTLHVLYEAAEDGTPLTSAIGSKLRFGLKLVNSNFCNFSLLNFTPGTSSMFWENKTAPGKLDPARSLSLTGDRLTHLLANAERPAQAALLDSTGNQLKVTTVAEVEKLSSVFFNLAGVPVGAISLEETYLTVPKKMTSYYHDPELQSAAVFGVAEIKIGAGFYAAPPAFEIPFAARSEVLKYYIVAGKYDDTDLAKLTVSDRGFVDEKRSEVKFDKVAASDFSKDELPAALLAPGDSKVVLFKSTAVVARQKKARRKIQLSRNGKVLIEHLPQPAPDAANADIIVHVAIPKP